MKINIYIILSLISFSMVELKSEITWQQTRPSHWLQQNRPIVCLDSTDCINLGDWDNRMMILRTTDGGFNWQGLFWDDWDPQTSLFLSAVNISYPAKNHIYISCNRMTILRTKDNFKTLDTIVLPSKYTNDGYYNYIRSITMLDTLFGTASTLGYVYLTRDGWETYEELSRFDELKPDSSYSLSYGLTYGDQVYLIDRMNFLIFIDFYKRVADTQFIRRNGIVKTSDGGKTWNFFLMSDVKEFNQNFYTIIDFYFLNNMIGWAAGRSKEKKSQIYKTIDGGLNWSVQYEDPDGIETNLLEIAFKNENEGIAVGKFGEVRTTYDGGETWVNETFAKDYDTRMERIVQFVAYAGNSPIISTFTGGIWRGTYKPTSVDAKKLNEGVISPNPASDYIEISIPDNANHTLQGVVKSGQVKVQIFNTLGIEVAQTPPSVISGQTRASDLLRIDISHLPTGVYFIKIGDRVEKFVKI